MPDEALTQDELLTQDDPLTQQVAQTQDPRTVGDPARPQDAPFPKHAPFVIEHRQEDYRPSGTFRPSAHLILTQRVRTSGLWRALTPEDFKTLLLLLTFVTPNGWCRPTLPELADAMGISHPKAKGRLERLVQARWQGQPLVELLHRPDGLDAYLPGRRLVFHEDAPVPEPPTAPPVRVAGREAVIAYSRARYAKTREEVERQIGEMMGWGPPVFSGDDPAVAEGKRRAFQSMTNLGMPKDQALDLLSRFDLREIEQQIAWLPSRGAKNPARYLAAAIEGGYDMPAGVRRQDLARRQALQETTLQSSAQRQEAAQGQQPETETRETDTNDKDRF